MLTPIATWNPARDVWETQMMGLFCEHWDAYLGTWPASGMTRAGTAFELPTLAPLMDGSGSSSLPTPRASRDGSATETATLLASPRTSDTNGPGVHGEGGMDLRTQVSLLPTPGASAGIKGRAVGTPPQARRDGGHQVELADIVIYELPGSLLPSPRVTDGTKGGPNQRGSSGDLMLPSAVTHLLPTPAVNDMGAGKTVDAWDAWDAWTESMQAKHGNGNGHGKSLVIEAQRLPPTPRSQNGEERNQNIWERPLDQPQNLENALARLPIGASTHPPSTDGNTSSDAPHLPLPSQDPKADND